jgi:folate-binding protein YgfZ
MSSAHLSHRGVIRVSGADKADYLQGIITQDVRLIAPDRLLYSCFLTPQGKYLADFFITQIGEDWYIDVDKSLLDDLLKRMNMYRLRSKVELQDVSSQFSILAFWNDGAPEGVLADPRAPEAGWRMFAPADMAGGQDDYNLWRLQHGLPDTGDFLRERSMMLECNMDLLHAVSFDKGCYMGQELTARTHYRALIKKRLLPIRFESEVQAAFDTPVQMNDKPIGLLRTTHKNHALALLNLENLEDGATVTVDGQAGQVFFPDWFTRP